VYHECAWGCRGQFVPSRYNSSRAKCIKCHFCGVFFSPNKFVFHSHRLSESDKYVQPDAANFNSWRRHTKLLGEPPDEIVYAWEDIKAMFNGGTRKRMMASATASCGGSNSHPRNSASAVAHSHSPTTSLHSPTSPKQMKLEEEKKQQQVLPMMEPFLEPSNRTFPYFPRFHSIESLAASSNTRTAEKQVMNHCTNAAFLT
jgi:hypothetical protein